MTVSTHAVRGGGIAEKDWRVLGIRRLCNDSRRVRRGDTFVAYPGAAHDGRRFIAQAIARGARSVLWDSRGFGWNPAWRVPNLGVPQLRARIGRIASEVNGEPSARLRVIGVTGTNGKTTCNQWIAQALTAAGTPTAVIGTLGYGMRGRLRPLANTTPDAIWLHEQLAAFARRAARAVSMEVSSIGLDQDRVAGVHFDTALFTNLTRDHLDYHRTLHRYRTAKARLFGWESLQHAIVNVDDAFGAELARRIPRHGLTVLGYGFSRAAQLRAANLVADARGVRFDVATPWGTARIASPALGRFNVYNLLATLAVLLTHGIGLRRAAAALAQLRPPPGRLQTFGGGRRPLVVVDYAHTPDALGQVLITLRAVAADARLTCVFGCGGGRDRGKRPLMGRIAARLADVVYVTSDNPRGEKPLAIIGDVLDGIHGVREALVATPDRRRAIRHAIMHARRGDVVLLAGKGHEIWQEIRGVRRPFSDAAEARAALREWRA
ncbi:MAG TPA: UDP-N-acetylmuramoyl-L-alanyl-D-glutamate--2,6-diaminopimelate ligase [Burkholderiales bacterium]|nr:UDP-N-acetylmuramoyl-L-alanyl-D-glutamate--2,6-diaminopimelate ligase [Burkholderiales bacterium]